MEKLKTGQTAYVDGLKDSNGKKYQGYMRFNKKRWNFEFSFRCLEGREKGKEEREGYLKSLPVKQKAYDLTT
ncbi:UNVERIFIED_CONTAM: hypothetical protein POZ17_15905 [Ralstonia mannitolilytica]